MSSPRGAWKTGSWWIWRKEGAGRWGTPVRGSKSKERVGGKVEGKEVMAAERISGFETWKRKEFVKNDL